MRWRSGSVRAVPGRRAPRSAPILFGAVLSLALIGLVTILLEPSRRVRAAALPRTPIARANVPTVITRPQTTGIGFIRTVAARQLRQADRQLDACGRQRAARLTLRELRGWRDCVKWPIAHLAVSARMNGALLGGLSNELPLGTCRALVLGTSNISRILGGEAGELLRGLLNTSRTGRGLSDQRYASVSGLVGTLRGMLRDRTWRSACRPTHRAPRSA